MVTECLRHVPALVSHLPFQRFNPSMSLTLFNSRVDLRPPPAEAGETNEDGTPTATDSVNAAATESADGANLPPPLLSDDQAGRRGNRLSGYLAATINPRRMRDATAEERIMALRRLRTASLANRRDTEGSRLPAPEADERSLSSRLRDRFRVRTRRQGADNAPAVATVEEDPPASEVLPVVR